jgi:hypothetical protein
VHWTTQSPHEVHTNDVLPTHSLIVFNMVAGLGKTGCGLWALSPHDCRCIQSVGSCVIPHWGL